MYLSLIFLPLFGAFFSNRWNGLNYGPKLSIISMLITQILTLISFYETAIQGTAVTINLGNWVQYEQLKLDWSFTFDILTISMFLPVIIISFLVQLYSLSYMSNDPHIIRFYFYLSIFTFFMLMLICGDNLLILFLGWEGVGLASYLLINFWFTRLAANLAAMKAFQINRIGDWGLMLGVILILSIVNDLSIPIIMSLGSYINSDLLFYIILLLMIGAMAKSAQFGLHTWLSDAMEGPTPVSALIHAATMVTAGVYLLMRISPLLEWSNLNSIIIIWLGSITALFGAACGLLENDLKKVIAFSTSSQLGYMVVACGISQYSISLFHLINHAFFKALLFLSAGAVLHAIMDEQDMRKMGSLILYLPITYAAFIIGSLSLMAFPFLTGFYSKDFLLEILLIPHNFTHSIAYFLTLLAAFLTSIYSIRLLILTFISKPNWTLKFSSSIADPHDFPMLFPLFLLSLGAIFFGYLTHELFLGFGSTFYFNSIFTHPDHLRLFDGSLSEYSLFKLLASLPLIFIISLFPIYSKKTTITTQNIYKQYKNNDLLNISSQNVVPLFWMSRILNHMNIFNHWIMHTFLNYSILLYRYWDKGLCQILGPQGSYKFLHFLSFQIELLSTGYILHYAMILIIFIILMSYCSLLWFPLLIIIYLFIYN